MYSHQKRYDLAITDLTEAIVRPDLPFFRQNRGINFLAAGQYEKALQDFSEAIRLNPKWNAYYWQRARAHAMLGHKELALADLEKAGDLNPNDADWNLERGKLLAQLEDHARAIKAFDKVLKLNHQNLEALIERANSYRILGKLDKATADVTEALLKKQVDPHAFTVLGMIEGDRNDLAGAIQDYTKALELDPTFPSPLSG